MVGLDRGQVGLQLALQHRLGLVGVARLLALADAEDRLEAGGERRRHLARQRLVGLAEVLAALGVAEDDRVDVELDQHRRRDLAGEGARVLLVHVLRGDLARRCRSERSTTALRAVNGGQMTTSCWVAAIRGSSASTKAAASATVLCIFQLAAMYGRAAQASRKRLHSRQLLSLQQLQRRSSSGREPVHLLSEAELVQRGDRVAAADHGRPGRRGDRLGDGAGAGGEGLQLEGAHRPVPEHGAGGGDRLGVGGGGARADVEPHPAVRHLDPVALAPLGRRVEALAEHQVDRQHQLAVGALGPLQRLRGQLHPLLLDQRVAGGDPLGAEEAEAHRAADQDAVGDLEEAVDHADLVGDLGAAEDDDQRPRGRLDHPSQLGHLALQQQAGVAGQAVGDALGAGVGAVGGAEGVVDVEVGQPGQSLGERRVVLGLPRLEADVLEQQHVAGPSPSAIVSTSSPTTAGACLHLGAEQLGQPLADRPHRERRVDLALGPAEVRDEDQGGAALAQQLDRRQRRPDPRVVGDAAAVERDVEVDPDQHPLAGDVGVADARLGEAHGALRTGLRGPCRPARRSGCE